MGNVFTKPVQRSVAPQPAPHMVYTLPSRLQYIASSDNIDNPSVPMRVGQVCIFLYIKSAEGECFWIGMSTSQIFSSSWRGMSSPPIFDTADEDIVGRIAYEVEVKQPCKSDYTTDRDEVRPTGRKVGTVMGAETAAGIGGQCCVKMEKWFVESELFVGRGTWRAVAPPPVEGQTVFMERADGSVASGTLHKTG